jgi:hypothetical protein
VGVAGVAGLAGCAGDGSFPIVGGDREPSLDLAIEAPVRLTNDADYNMAPYALIDPETHALRVFYRSGREHGVSEARIVMRESTDGGATWSDERTVANAAHDTRLMSVDVDSWTGLAGMWYRAYRSPDDQRQRYRYSDDHGASWSDPIDTTEVYDHHTPPLLTFGYTTRTRHGAVVTGYHVRDGGNVKAIFSDDFETWGDPVTVLDAEGDAVVPAETVPVAIDEDRVVTFVRENSRNEPFFGAIESTDGGQTWGEPTWWNVLDNGVPTPLYVRDVGGRLLASVATRGDPQRGRGLYVARVDPEDVWNDPGGTLRAAEWELVAESNADSSSDWGYSTTDPSGTLIAWYDDDPPVSTPDIYVDAVSNHL